MKNDSHIFREFFDDSFHILEAIDEPCSIIDKNYCYRFVNKAYEKFLNVARKNIISRPIHFFIEKDYFYNTVKPYFDACLKGEKVKFLHHKIQNNSIIAYEVAYFPKIDENNEIEAVVSKIRDVSDTILLKQQLINSKQKWSNSVNALEDILIIINTNFEIEDINEAGLKLIDKSKYEVLGKKCYNILRGNDEPVKDCLICSNAQNKPFHIHEWYNEKNNRYYEVKTAPVRNIKGEIIKYVDLFHDITSLKQKENELRDSQERYRSLFNNSLDGVLFIDTKGNIIEANEQLIKILGSPSLEATKSINVFEFEPLIKMGYSNDMKQCIKKGKSVFGKNHYKTKWGKELYLNYYFNPIRKNGKIIGVLANVEDKTEEYQSKIDKEKSDEKYRLLAQNATDIVIILNYQLDVLYVSPSCQSITDFTPEEFEELKGFDIIYKDDIDFAYQLGRKIMRGENKRGDIRLNKKDGSQLWVDVEGKAIIFNNQGCVLLTGRDISERKHFENKIQLQNSELKKLNQTKDKLFSIISHDLKNPLNNILGFSRILINNVESKQNEKLYSFINHIHTAADRLHILLENLLNWSRSQLGAIQYNPENHNINKLIDDCILSIKVLASNKNISIENKVCDSFSAHFDQNLISVVIMNLLTNAIKFSHEDSYIKVKSRKQSDFIEICVQDQGIGIEEQNISKLFSNCNFTTRGTNNEKGTGLGLGIVKEFVELNKGEIWVQSGKNMGSKFYFTLPIHNI